jgi:hypothetical protein
MAKGLADVPRAYAMLCRRRLQGFRDSWSVHSLTSTKHNDKGTAWLQSWNECWAQLLHTGPQQQQQQQQAMGRVSREVVRER